MRPHHAETFQQILVHDAGRCLLGLPPTAGLGPDGRCQFTDSAFDFESLGVVGPGFLQHFILRQVMSLALQQLLQSSLGVLQAVGLGKFTFALFKQGSNDSASLFETTIEKHRSDQGLDDVRQN